MSASAISIGVAAALGVLEGLTEFIPVSSTGHLVLLQELLDWQGAQAETFAIFIQLGAILAVVLLYWGRFWGLLDFSHDHNGSKGFKGWPGVVKLGLGCLPAFILGPLVHSSIKAYLFSPLPIAMALVTGGVMLVLIEQRRGVKPSVECLEDISYAQSFWIGVAQCAALWPGMSRSGSTIIGALLLGCHRTVAAEFSFLLAVPVMAAAVSYDLLKSAEILTVSALPIFAVGFLVSLVTAALAIHFFMAILQRYSLAVFGWYRIVLGIGIIVVVSLF